MRNLGDTWASGNGLFETIRVEDGKVFALHRHHCRAKESAEKLGFEIPDEEYVARQSYQVIQNEAFQLEIGRAHV